MATKYPAVRGAEHASIVGRLLKALCEESGRDIAIRAVVQSLKKQYLSIDFVF
jgi:hypothetical protein